MCLSGSETYWIEAVNYSQFADQSRAISKISLRGKIGQDFVHSVLFSFPLL